MHHRGGPGIGMVQGLLHRLGDYIELTEDQRTQIEAIAEQARTQIQPLVEQARAERQAFRSSHQPGDFDEVAFRNHAQKQAQIHVDIQVAAARAMSQATEVLTPEQLEKLEELRGLFGRRGGGGPGFHGGGPPKAR
jgi:Spy/CpxP family protein refolding chaperone